MAAQMLETDCRRLCLVRLEDAQVLLHSGRFAAAYYISGYSVELALKAVIAKKFRANEIPDPKFVQKIYTHKLEDLVSLAGLREDLLTKIEASEPFAGNWGVVKEWVPEVRYELVDQVATQVMLHAIVHENDGVLPWIRSYWTKEESVPEQS